MRPTADELAATLGLAPHPEGGFFRETYRASQVLRTARGDRAASTAILFLVTAGSVSRLHRLTSDELWVFQGGWPLELVTISEDGASLVRVLGDFVEILRSHDDAMPPTAQLRGGIPEAAGERLPQALVPAGSWQGARLASGPHLPAERAWALVSCIVTPGFDFADFELGERAALLAAHPQHAAMIRALT